MTDTELIAQQARRIATLEAVCKNAIAILDEAHVAMIGVGGPMNDNKLQYTSEQRAPLWRVNNQIELVLSSLAFLR